VDPRLDRDRLEDIIQALGDRLDGDWLLVGVPWWHCGSSRGA
jgi:hypothetical protein